VTWLRLSEQESTDLRWKDISIIFQGAMNAFNPVRTVGDQIAEAILRIRPLVSEAELDKRVVELLDLVGIAAES
jgi:ABC-type dipeptide/oligopeptide/nickel transport system ATPase component